MSFAGVATLAKGAPDSASTVGRRGYGLRYLVQNSAQAKRPLAAVLASPHQLRHGLLELVLIPCQSRAIQARQ